MLSVYYEKICIKFASHHLLMYVVYMCQKSLNFTYAFKCYQQNVSGFTLAGPPGRLGAFPPKGKGRREGGGGLALRANLGSNFKR